MKFVLSILFLTTLGCATVPPPLEDYTLAKASLEAAQSVGAMKHSPGNWFKAEEAYRLGEAAFRKGDFKEAQLQFLKTKDFAEKAENKARYDRAKNGEDFL